MATKESIALKLRNLIESGNTTTGKTDENLTDVFRSLIAGYGQGGTDTSDATAMAWHILKGETAYGKDGKTVGTIPTYEGQFTEGAEIGGGGIIEVDELPTENINKDAVYKRNGWQFKAVIAMEEDGEPFFVNTIDMLLSILGGMPVYRYYVPTMPSVEEAKLSHLTTGIHWYYAEDVNDAFIYGEDNSGVTRGISIKEAYGSIISTLKTMECKGTITDISEITEVGYYILVEKGVSYHKYVEDSIVDIYICDPEASGNSSSPFGNKVPFSYATAIGIPSDIYLVQSKPKNNIKVSSLEEITSGFGIYLYYVIDEGDVFLCIYDTDANEYDWITLGELIGEDDPDNAPTFQGCVLNYSEMVNPGYYALVTLAGFKTLISEHEIVPNTAVITPNKDEQVIFAAGHPVNNSYTRVEIEPIPSEYIIPSGSRSITSNGTYNVSSYESAIVNVPIPDGYVLPEGSITITENGTYNVVDKAEVVVNVAGGDTLPNAEDNVF